MQFPNKRLKKKISTAATSTRSPQAAVTCRDKGGGVMSCPLLQSQHLLEDGCFSDGITAACKSSEACPSTDRQPNLASLAGRCSLAPMTFAIRDSFKVPLALTAQVTPPGKGCRDSCWKSPQAHYHTRRKLVSCQFLAKPLPSLGCFAAMCQMFREVSPSKQESSF